MVLDPDALLGGHWKRRDLELVEKHEHALSESCSEA